MFDYVLLFVFFSRKPHLPESVFCGSGERVKFRLFQALTRGARPDSNSRPAVLISSPLLSHYVFYFCYFLNLFSFTLSLIWIKCPVKQCIVFLETIKIYELLWQYFIFRSFPPPNYIFIFPSLFFLSKTNQQGIWWDDLHQENLHRRRSRN